jgi:hypothetical protein
LAGYHRRDEILDDLLSRAGSASWRADAHDSR